MDRINVLKTKIDQLYSAKYPTRAADWADWLFENHIYVVSEYAKRLAEELGANRDVSMAASMLHDVADAVMDRFDPRHEEEGRVIALRLLNESGFTKQEIEIIVDDAIRFHSCHDGNVPQSLEGKIMATSDALAHLKTDFYPNAFGLLKKKKTDSEIKQWALSKVERDFHEKIFFESAREEARPYYEKLKALALSMKEDI